MRTKIWMSIVAAVGLALLIVGSPAARAGPQEDFNMADAAWKAVHDAAFSKKAEVDGKGANATEQDKAALKALQDAEHDAWAARGTANARLQASLEEAARQKDTTPSAGSTPATTSTTSSPPTTSTTSAAPPTTTIVPAPGGYAPPPRAPATSGYGGEPQYRPGIADVIEQALPGLIDELATPRDGRKPHDGRTPSTTKPNAQPDNTKSGCSGGACGDKTGAQQKGVAKQNAMAKQNALSKRKDLANQKSGTKSSLSSGREKTAKDAAGKPGSSTSGKKLSALTPRSDAKSTKQSAMGKINKTKPLRSKNIAGSGAKQTVGKGAKAVKQAHPAGNGAKAVKQARPAGKKAVKQARATGHGAQKAAKQAHPASHARAQATASKRRR